MSVLKTTLAAAAIAGTLMTGSALAQENQMAPTTFTQDEVDSLKSYFNFSACADEAEWTVNLFGAMGAFDSNDQAQEAYDQMIAECETTHGMTIDEANALMQSLADKYGQENLQDVYDNSVSMFEEPAAPVPSP